MADKRTFSAASLEDAITMATLELGIPSDRLGYEIIDKGSKGFLGIGTRQTIIEAWEKTEEETVSEPVKPVKEEKPAEKKAAPEKKHTR